MAPQGNTERHRDRRRRSAGFACLLALQFPVLAESSFRTGILPILTKAGCNAGACHGAATGQGGFKLSLLGYDPEEDHDRISRELGGRRLDFSNPAESLFLLKPGGQLEHEGGRRLPRGSASQRKVLEWISQGAPYGPKDLQVEAIVAAPADQLFDSAGQTLTLQVTARLSDGSETDVTALALYTAQDEGIADVGKSGEVTARGRGLTSIMVRYSGQVASVRVAIPYRDTELSETGFPAFNFIDESIVAELRRLRLPASPPCDDAEFVRRVHLDVVGRLPSPEPIRAFLKAPPSRSKREGWVDALLRSEDFTDFWTLKLADLLLLGGKGTPENATQTYHAWLRAQVATNAPIDRIAQALLTSTGDLDRVGPANLMMLASDPRDLAEHIGRIFLGSQIGCARCHAHPNDRWTQTDYHRFAAYFARVQREAGRVSVATHGEVNHPKTGQPMQPKPLGTTLPSTNESISEPTDRRAALALWLASPANPSFTRTFVNRVWKHLLGRGLVEPVDDLRPTNPSTHPALLDALAADFVAGGMDLRRLVRVIVTSQTYQLTSEPRGINGQDQRLYSHAYLKELPAQVFADAVVQVTGVPDHFEGYPPGTRAVQLIGPRTASPALDVLGRCSREGACDSPARAGGGLARALHLINGSTINDKLHGGRLESLLAGNPPIPKIIDDLYLQALSRPPTAAEQAGWTAVLATAADRVEAIQDLLWALLNSREFAFNH